MWLEGNRVETMCAPAREFVTASLVHGRGESVGDGLTNDAVTLVSRSGRSTSPWSLPRAVSPVGPLHNTHRYKHLQVSDVSSAGSVAQCISR